MSSTNQFSAAFKVLPVLDYPQTPAGFLAMATRKVGERVFIRASDMMLPNVGQFPSGGNTAEQEECATRPGITRWVVPLDNENSFYLGFGYVNAHNSRQRPIGLDSYGVGKIPVLGQTADYDLHIQVVQREEARTAGRTASRRLLQGGPAARGDRQSAERSCQAAFRSWEPTYAWDDHHVACGTGQREVTAPRWQPEQGSSRSPAWRQAREPAAPRDADPLASRSASGCPRGFA